MSDVLPLLLPAAAQSELAAEAPKVLALEPTIVAIQIRGQEDETFLSDVLHHVKEKIKQLETARKAITVHLDRAKKAIDAQYKPARDAYENLEKLIKSRLGEAENTRRQAAIAAQKEATKLAATGTFVELAKPQASVQGLQYVETWEHELIDLKALCRAVLDGQAPANFVMQDYSAIKIWLRTYKDSREVPAIPGLKFERKTAVRAI